MCAMNAKKLHSLLKLTQLQCVSITENAENFSKVGITDVILYKHHISQYNHSFSCQVFNFFVCLLFTISIYSFFMVTVKSNVNTKTFELLRNRKALRGQQKIVAQTHLSVVTCNIKAR